MRREDWPERLSACIEAARQQPFAWGSHDCALFAASCVAAITGADPVPQARGAYTDAAGARRWLKGLTLAGAMNARYGPPIKPSFARRGDIALVLNERDRHWPKCLGVVLGTHVAVPGPQGLQFVTLAAAEIAWRID